LGTSSSIFLEEHMAVVMMQSRQL